MTGHILLIQGAGEGAYTEDQKLAASLTKALGTDYEVHFPALPDEENAPYEQWTQQIEKELAAMPGEVVLAGHSVGASVIIKWMSEAESRQPVAGVFLLATPFWGGDGWRYEGYETLTLPEAPADRLLQGLPLFFYHCRDDEVVPFDHLALYAKIFPQAVIREIDTGGHQFNNDLSVVAGDIKSLR